MRIDHTGGPRRLAVSPARRGQGGFAVAAEALPPAEAVEPAVEVTAIAGVDASGSADPAESAAPDDRSAARHGDQLLEALAGLQLAALTGGGDAAWEKLANLSVTPSRAADPQLDAVVQGIAARAAVELARRR